MNKLSLNHYKGCIIGGAIGDALGAPIEFMSMLEISRKFGPNGVSDFVESEDEIGRITDDTQMLLFTADGMLRSINSSKDEKLSAGHLDICWHSYLCWLLTQKDWHANNSTKNVNMNDSWLLNEPELFKRRAPGNTCLTALRDGICGTMERPLNDSKGGGGIMRIAPVGLLCNSNPELTFKTGCELAAMTHGHPSGYLSSGAFASIIGFINSGYTLENSIQESIKLLRTYKDHEETLNAMLGAISLFEQGAPTSQKIEKLGGAWVGEEALAISIYCALHHPNDFEKAIVLSINHGGDTDSTGSLVGNLVGLINGADKIPERWMNNIELKGLLNEMSEDLFGEMKDGEEWKEKYKSKNEY